MRAGSFLRAVILATSIAAGLSSCSETSPAAEADSTRLWGREKLAAQTAALAKQPINARAAAEDLEVRHRILDMEVQEVVARIGFIVYRGKAKFNLERNDQGLEVFEDTLIEHALHGNWRVLQRDADGDILREKVFSNGLYYMRNGNGALRLQGVADAPGGITRKEAFEPLSSFTSWYGARLGLSPAGSGLVHGRAVVKYRFGLAPGTELVEDPNRPGKRLRPRKLSGQLSVDADTGAPMAATLRGELDVEPPPGGSAWGRLEVQLDFEIAPRPDDPIVVTEFVPMIERRPKDLDPLGFLKGKTQTSTVIGGPGS